MPTLPAAPARFSIVIHRQTVPLLADCELPEVVIEPSHDDLDDVMQDLEGDRGRHLDLTPDQGIGVPQFDTNSGDLVEAVGCDVLTRRIHHAASLAGRSEEHTSELQSLRHL